MHEGLAGGRKRARRWAAPNTIISVASLLSFSRGVVQVREGVWVGSGESEPWLKEQETTAWTFSGTRRTWLPWFYKTRELTPKVTTYEEAPPSAPKVLTRLRNHMVRDMRRSVWDGQERNLGSRWKRTQESLAGMRRMYELCSQRGLLTRAIVRDPCLLGCPPQSTRGVQTWIP